jgi:flavorubredoxin
MYPLIEKLVSAIEHREIANRIYACFGSYTWASKATKMLTELPEKMKWEMVGSVDNKQAVSVEKYEEAYQLGKKLAEAILK